MVKGESTREFNIQIFSEHLYPICLPMDDSLRTKDFYRTYPFIPGCGVIETQEPASENLLETQLSVVTNQACKDA
ncbi:venom serine protease Bi-VSP-like [Calliopsis andreniformis]|uniref:venom serine protease Bi-VSP-like n=1 Tax=Calliopsis andreniformis TaxID=337506 RepID=UPI003FCC64DD